MYKVKILQNSSIKELCAEDGAQLSQVLAEHPFAPEHPCGGRGICQKCRVLVNGKEELSCCYHITSDITVTLPERAAVVSAVGQTDSLKVGEHMCLCLDIGTTTLAMALVALPEGRIVKTLVETNPQTTFGADVMSRIDYATRKGAAPLTRAVLIAAQKMAEQLYESFGVTHLPRLYVTGNTTMLHLFFGEDCTGMGVSPYTPAFLEGKEVAAVQLGIRYVDSVHSLPNISAFVGADIVAGLGYVAPPSEGKYNLFLDLGTNAEMVLYSRSHKWCTAAAAGPCFEGAGISCGMSGRQGAVCSYQDGKCEVIGGGKPIGLCATGLIDVIAHLVRTGVIDETGYMEDEFAIAEGVCLQAGDVRQFQLAKSAVCAGLITLLREANVTPDKIERFYVAGGISDKLSLDNALEVGLFPRELAERFVPVNNASLLGTVRYAAEQTDLTAIVRDAEYVDLSTLESFSQLFMDHMMY